MATILVLLAAYNEALALPSLIAEFRRVQANVSGDLRVLVVDDGSTDATAAAATDAAGDLPLEVLRHSHNRGLGAALRSGFDRGLEEARDEDLIATLDADGSHSPRLLPQLVEALESPYGVVIASRYRPGSVSQGVPLSRTIASFGARVLVDAVAAIPGVRDYTCGYRVYRADALRRARREIPDLPREAGFACQLELLVALARTGARMREIPLTLRYDKKESKSKLRWRDAVLGNLRVLRSARTLLRNDPPVRSAS